MSVLASAPLDALDRAWPPFVLVAALLVLGLVAERESLFAWTGARLERLPGPPVALLCASLAAVAVVTAVLNLDTAVVFVTPVAIAAARRRGVDPRPVAYGSLVMANAASLLLPGANLTNLLVREADPDLGRRWLTDVAPAGLAAAFASLAVLVVVERLRGSDAAGVDRPGFAAAATDANGAPRPGALGVAATAAAAVLVLVLDDPALPVLAVAVAAWGIVVLRRRGAVLDAVRAVGPASLAALLALATALGWLARSWDGPARLLHGTGAVGTAVVGAVSAVLVNNLPATTLLTAVPPERPAALLIGLDLGPNLLVTGSLAAWLWWRTCRAADVAVTLRGLAARAPLTVVPAAAVALLLVHG